jgi:hypothetical protein
MPIYHHGDLHRSQTNELGETNVRPYREHAVKRQPNLIQIKSQKELHMKAKTLLSTALLAIFALALAAPAVAQSLHGPGLTIHWQTFLRGDAANTWALAEYDAFTASVAPSPSPKDTLFTKFTVSAITPRLLDGTKLGVYLGPSTNPQEPYGKLVGVIVVESGVGGMVLIDAKAPVITKGTTVTVTNIGPIPFGRALTLQGSF